MAKEGQSLQVRVGKWLGVQVAAKAVQLALGSAIVSGATMGVLAWVQDLPLATGFLAVVLASAGAVTILNQVRAFIVAYSVEHKLPRIGVGAEAGTMAATGPIGYAVKVHLHNQADVPLEYSVSRCSLQLDGRVALQSPGRSGNILPPGIVGFHSMGLVPMEYKANSHIAGEIELTVSYGRVGKLIHERTEHLSIYLTTDPNGAVAETRVYLA